MIGGNIGSLDSRIYCITDIDPEHRKLSQLEAIVSFLKRQDPYLQCECGPAPILAL